MQTSLCVCENVTDGGEALALEGYLRSKLVSYDLGHYVIAKLGPRFSTYGKPNQIWGIRNSSHPV